MELGKKYPWFSRLPCCHVVFELKIESCFKTMEQAKPPTQQCFLWLSLYFEHSTAMLRPYKFFHWCDRVLKCITSLRPLLMESDGLLTLDC